MWFLLFSLAVSVIALDNGLGKTPQMGFVRLFIYLFVLFTICFFTLIQNTWNHFGCKSPYHLILTIFFSWVDALKLTKN